MKVVFHPRFTDSYTHDPAAAPGRIEPILKALEGKFAFVEPDPAVEADLALVHTTAHIQRSKKEPEVYEMARLAAGGAIEAARRVSQDDPSFALIRPPGHHASPDSCWGFCYFNNLAISIRKLIQDKEIETAFILDVDLHHGDGTENAFCESTAVVYHHPEGAGRQDYIESVWRVLEEGNGFDILAVSAGFDRHEDDWGGTLTTEDYGTIGRHVREAALRVCGGKRFGVLEGGYNHAVLGENVRAFIEGME
jgi:acetoin utilization deacetylase AcuC-like enzyme